MGKALILSLWLVALWLLTGVLGLPGTGPFPDLRTIVGEPATDVESTDAAAIPPEQIFATFSRNDGFTGDHVVLARDGRYVWSSWSCTMGGTTEGRATWANGAVHFVTDDGARESLHVVPWGSRRYLLREIDLLDFCNAVNAGSEPAARSRHFLAEEPLGAVFGSPELPAPWDAHVLPDELSGRTSVEPDGSVWVSLGSDDGLRPGMVLFLHGGLAGGEWHEAFGSGRASQPLELVELEADRASVRFRHGADRKPAIPGGLVVSSRLP